MWRRGCQSRGFWPAGFLLWLATALPISAQQICVLRTANGRYVTAVDGGGRTTDVIHTDATAVGPWEKFTLVSLGGNQYALRTVNGQYLTAVDGGGRTTDVLHTDARAIGPWEKFTQVPLGGNQYAFQTVNGQYLTAVDGGARTADVIHADARAIGPWEKFTLEVLPGQDQTGEIDPGPGGALPGSPPRELRASAPGPVRVLLEWKAPQATAGPTGYQVFRGEDAVGGALPADQTSFSDRGVIAKLRYR